MVRYARRWQDGGPTSAPYADALLTAALGQGETRSLLQPSAICSAAGQRHGHHQPHSPALAFYRAETSGPASLGAVTVLAVTSSPQGRGSRPLSIPTPPSPPRSPELG